MNRPEKEFGLSMRHLNRIFKEGTGMSMTQYKRNRKIEVAENLLYSDQKSL